MAYLVAVGETLIAVALITGFARKLTYSAAIVFSLLIWSTTEGFGGPHTSRASDTTIIYAVVFAGLLSLSCYAGLSRFSAAREAADRLIRSDQAGTQRTS